MRDNSRRPPQSSNRGGPLGFPSEEDFLAAARQTRGAFRELRDKLDPGKSNGSVLLGLNGIVVKSHGGTDAEGFASAIEVGYEMVHFDLLTKINQMLNRDGALVPEPAA